MIKLGIVFFTIFSSHLSLANDTQHCSGSIISLMKKDAFHSNDGDHKNDELKAYSCKKYSDNPDYTLASYFQLSEKYKKNNSYHWRVLLIKNEQSVESSYTGFINEEAEIEVGDAPVFLDTQDYYINDHVKAFGVILNVGYTAPCSTAGRNKYLSLFVNDHDNINRVLIDYPMQNWFILKGNSCFKDRRVIKQIINSYIEVQESKTNGFYDLMIKNEDEIENGREEVLDNKLKVTIENRLLKFNGDFYK
ncbi:PA3715 family protein [Photobacterium sp. R1]